MLVYSQSVWLFLLILLPARVAATQEVFVVFSFDSVRAPQLHRGKFPFTDPDTNGFRMHAQLFGYFFDRQPLSWHKFSPLVPFVVSDTTLLDIIRFSVGCVNGYSQLIFCNNLTIQR
jgi:hypothetical protein